MLFTLGQIVATPGAMALAEKGVDLLVYLQRHLHCDRGDLDEHDRDENDFSVDNYVESLTLWGYGKWDLDGRFGSHTISVALVHRKLHEWVLNAT